MSFQALPGFRDVYPADAARRDALFETWRRVSERFGFARVDGPPLEPLELYKRKSGEEIVKQLFAFTDQGGREVALRPELTPTVARMVGAHARDFKKPIKWFGIPQLFRYERQQKGRLREHFQWNCDIFGEETLAAEAELLAVLVAGLEALGLRARDVEIRVSDRLFWSAFMDRHGVVEEERYRFLQVLDKLEREDPARTREQLGSLAEASFAAIESQQRNERLDELMGRVADLGLEDWVSVDLRIVRGLAYYTGIVFEVHDRARAFRAIAGGGRYDHLVGLLGGEPLAACGFGMGDVVLLELLREKGLEPKRPQGTKLYVVVADETARSGAMRLVAGLRRNGYAVEYPFGPMKVGKQFQQAEERGATHALVVDAGLSEGRCALKTLATRAQIDLKLTWDDSGPIFDPPLPD
ncbi:MAG: histidine--tRNA ligase [Candidatus Methylacidiphilales bacterium]